eukprot:117038_1
MGISGGYLISAAVKYTLVEIYSGIYNPEEVEEVSSDILWSIYLAFFIVLIVSALIMTYLSRFIKAARSEKHKIFKRWKEELEKSDENIDKKLTIMNNEENKDKNGDDDNPMFVEDDDGSTGLLATDDDGDGKTKNVTDDDDTQKKK